MKPDYFDIHAHVNFAVYDNDRAETVARAHEEGVWMINVGTQNDTSQSAVELAERYEEGVYATIGLHPIHTDKSFRDKKELVGQGSAFTSRGEVFDRTYYEALASSNKVVAIGECGLDYYRLKEDTKEKQKKAFVEQIELANELDKPLMLHIRNAYRDAYELISSHARVSGNVHFFAGTWEEAKLFLEHGFTLSFTGVITFTTDYNEVIKNTPLDMIMTETDAPYVTPVPYRGKRNEPLYVTEIVRQIAEIKRENSDLVAKELVSNAERVFGPFR